MSRLDHHIAAVQNKLALSRFFGALAKTVLIFFVGVIVAILLKRFFKIELPKPMIWLWSALGAATVSAVVIAMMRRPAAHDAAAAIDDVLGIKDKFATALHARHSKDEFAIATVRDAERTAEQVNLHKKFPLKFPRAAIYTCIAMIVAFSVSRLPSFDLFGKEEKKKQEIEKRAQVDRANKTLKEALAVVESAPKVVQNDEKVKLAKRDLVAAMTGKIDDPNKASRTAAKALQDLNEAFKQQMQSNQRYADAQNDAKMFKQLSTPIDEQGPVADAQRALQKGDFNAAVDELTKLTEKFDKMEKKDQEQAQQQMQKLAQQLQQMAKNPEQQQQMQKQLQQQLQNAGMDEKQAQQQAQQMQQQMQQAANGDQQAQQQVQKMAQQAMQQLQQQAAQGNQQAQQQLQQLQQMMQQMQGMANNQQQAQQMQQAAQQMAQAMQQAQQGQPQQGQPQGQQMQQGMQQMQAQLQQMQAAAQDAQQIGAAQQQAQQAMNNAMNGINGGQPNQNGQWGQGQQNGGDPNQPWNGQANNNMQNPGGQGAGDRSGKAEAPYTVKQEISPSLDDEKGKILATMLVKDKNIKGESKEQIKEVAESALKEAADEIDQDRVSRQAQKVVKDYFRSIQKDAENAPPPPTTQPK